MTKSRCKSHRPSLARLTAGILAPLALTACAPSGFQVASMVADGISYIETGKSLTDHGLSLIADADCETMRALQDKPICTSRDDGTRVAKGDKDGKKQATTMQVAELDAGADPSGTAPATAASMPAKDDATSTPAGASQDDGSGLIPSNFERSIPVQSTPIAPPRTSDSSREAADTRLAAAEAPVAGDTARTGRPAGRAAGASRDSMPRDVITAALAPDAFEQPRRVYYGGAVAHDWDWSGQQVALNGY